MKKSKTQLTERRLRKIIREEMSRQHLLEEGFVDAIKAPFKSLSDKVKQEISAKASEATQKLMELIKTLETGAPMDEVKQFLSYLEKEPTGGSVDDLMSQVPDLEKLSNDVDVLKKLDPKDLVSSETSKVAAESFDKQHLKSFMILLDEEVVQRRENHAKSHGLLRESVFLTAFTVWWTFEKTVVGGLGLLYWSLKFFSWVLDKFGFKGASKNLKSYAEKVHHLEDSVIKLTVFPPPVQYAAYAAYKKMTGEKPLSYKEFTDPKNKEGKASQKETFKVLKFALLIPMLVDAMVHLGQALAGTFQTFGDFAKTAKYSAKVASETGAAAKIAPGIGAAAQAV